MKKSDMILIIAIIAVALLIALGFSIFRPTATDTVIVELDGDVVKKLPLDKDTEYRIDCPDGGFNLLIIKDGRAYVSEASCPDKVCIHTGAVGELKPVVCRPNKIVITLSEG